MINFILPRAINIVEIIIYPHKIIYFLPKHLVISPDINAGTTWKNPVPMDIY